MIKKIKTNAEIVKFLKAHIEKLEEKLKKYNAKDFDELSEDEKKDLLLEETQLSTLRYVKDWIFE